MSAEQGYRLGRTFGTVGFVCWLIDPGSIATIIISGIALVVLLRSEAAR